MKLGIVKTDLVGMLAAHIRDKYIEFRRLGLGNSNYELHAKWDGSEDSAGRGHKNVWPSIAQFMLDNQLNVSSCLALCFDLAQDRTEIPLPSHITAPWRLTGYREVSDTSPQLLGYMLTAEKQLCRTEFYEATSEFGMSGEDALRYILGNESLALSPLFRFCLAYSENMTDMVEEFKLDAVLQYIVSMDGYDKAWDDWVPGEFRRQTRLAFDRSVTNRKGRYGKEESPA